MKIGLISDTHIPTRAKKLPEKVKESFEGVDLIIHCGDWVSLEVLDELKGWKVLGVKGNMDWEEIGKRFPEFQKIELEGRKIGVLHDAGNFPTVSSLYQLAKKFEVDILIFGHTHRQFYEKFNQKVFVNPGSPTNPLPPFVVKPSVAILELEKEIKVNFVYL